MTKTDDGATAPAVDDIGTERRQRRRLYAVLAVLAYVPPLITHPGKVAADTKQYLYLDPSRLLGRAASMWDPNIGFGTVTHQNIGYLFPMGPYYWLFQALRVPDWVAQRLWLGSLVFFAGLGVIYLLRTLGVKGPGVAIAALAYMFAPYSLDYASRISVLLMPWAGLGWMIALTVKALRDGKWRYPALFALVVQLVGGVNATALIFAGVGPVLWIVCSCVTGQVSLRRALNVTLKIGGLTLLTSLWWMAGLWAQGSYGLDILKYTETVKAVSRTSTPNEVLRGLGYWFFYGQDAVGPWTEASINYTQHIEVIVAGYTLAALALTGAAVTRWRHRAFFLVMTFIGVVIAVGAYPYSAPTPLGSLFKSFANSSAAGLALRSTGRAIPLVTLGLAIMLGIGVNAAATRFTTPKRPQRGLVIAGVIVALIVIDFPALYDGTYYGKNLERPENVPAYWIQATKYLDQGPHTTRVLEVPGSDFASYVWGDTVDPVTPGLMDRPYVARELIPWGGPAAQDLLNAVDERLQQGTFEADGFVPLARRMGVGAVDLRNDLQFKRYDTVPPLDLQRDFENVPGLSSVKTFGKPLAGKSSAEFVDESALALSPGEAEPYDVAVYNVLDPTPILRTESSARPLVVAGDGEGLVDMADVGLLDNAGVVLYSASYANDPTALRQAAGSDGVLVVTDSNRKRARRWSTVVDNVGYTEQAGEKPLVSDQSDARLDTFPGAGDDAYTVTDQVGVKSIQATAYGNPITYTPEDRATRAFDGNTDTSWTVAAFDLAIGNRIQLVTQKPITTDRVHLVQKQNGPQDRWITQVTLTFDGGHPFVATLDPTSRVVGGQTLVFPKRTFSKLDIEISNTSDGRRRLNPGAAAVGFAEIDVKDEHATQPIREHDVVRMPLDLLAAEGKASLSHPLVLLMTRERVLPVPPRTDEDLAISREFTLPTARTFSLTGTARLTPDALGAVIDGALGLPTEAQGGIDARAREFLAGCVRCRSDDAIDGDPATAWVTPFIGVRRQFVSYQFTKPITFDHMDMQIVADTVHSRPTLLELTVDGAVRWIKVPELPVHSKLNSTDQVTVHFPKVTGNHIAVKIVSIDDVRVASKFSKQKALAPVGIAELGIPGLRMPTQPSLLPGNCRSDLLHIDGKPVPVRITGSAAAAQSLQPLTISTCDPSDPTARPTVTLAPGTHEVDTRSGQLTALQLDRLVLASAAGGGAGTTAGGKVTVSGAPLTAPKFAITHNGRTKMQVTVTGATGPFWLVLGESQNAGWQATVHGARSLGGSRLVDGFANGWRIDPGGKQTLVVDLEWMPQRKVWAALALSGFGGILCCGLIAAGFLRARRVALVERFPDAGDDLTPVFTLPWLPAGASPGLRTQVITAILGAATAAAVAGVGYGVLVGAALVVTFRVPRLRAAIAVVPPVLVVLIGFYIANKQLRDLVPPVFEWPTLFGRATAPAWVAIVLFGADALYETVRRGRRRTDHED